MTVVKEYFMAWPGSASTFESNIITYFESLSDDISGTYDSETYTSTIDFNELIQIKFKRHSSDSTYYDLYIVKNGVTYNYGSNQWAISRVGLEIYSVIDGDTFLIWMNTPYNSSDKTNSLNGFIENGPDSQSLMICVFKNDDNDYCLGHKFNCSSSSNRDILSSCDIEKSGDTTVNNYKMVDIFDYKSKIGYIDFVFGATFCTSLSKAFKCSKFANSSTVAGGESYSLSSGVFYSISKNALISL